METKVYKSDKSKSIVKDGYALVNRVVKAGDKVENHMHKGEDVLAYVAYGEVVFTLDNTNKLPLVQGDIANFSGDQMIALECIKDAKVLITLIKR